MSWEERLRDAIREATGDDAIVDVAEFHPRGFAAAAGAGAGLGSAAGGDSTLGSVIGATGGTAAGMAVVSAARDLPMRICVAISPAKVYLAEIEGTTGPDKVTLFAQLDRSGIGVEVHGRAFNRVVVIEDLQSHAKYEMEAPRAGPYHAKALVELLLLSDEHLEPETSQT